MQTRHSRRTFLAIAGGGLAGLAGCLDDVPGSGSGSGDGADSGSGDGGSDGTTTGGGNSDGGDSQAETRLPLREAEVPLSRDLEEYASSAMQGAAKDAIPSIGDPKFGSVSDGNSMMDPGDPVFGVELDGDARAYPQHILVWHEIVNDQFGDSGITVTYCPLTGTAVGFERGPVSFGVSGKLINSNLVMYDRETNTWWPQVLGTGVRDDLTGKALNEVRVTWTTWERWQSVHPETSVLTEDTGYVRNYDDDPYGSYNSRGGYYDNGNMLFNVMHQDSRLDPKEVVIGARTADGAMAFHKNRLSEAQLLETTVDGTSYLAAYDPDLHTGYVYRNPDGESYEARSGGFAAPDGTSHRAGDLPLESVNAFDAMWFAWAAFYPETALED